MVALRKSTTIRLGFGVAYGAAAWALGLGKKPTEVPASQQLQFLAARLVYGITLEGVRRAALKAW